MVLFGPLTFHKEETEAGERRVIFLQSHHGDYIYTPRTLLFLYTVSWSFKKGGGKFALNNSGQNRIFLQSQSLLVPKTANTGGRPDPSGRFAPLPFCYLSILHAFRCCCFSHCLHFPYGQWVSLPWLMTALGALPHYPQWQQQGGPYMQNLGDQRPELRTRGSFEGTHGFEKLLAPGSSQHPWKRLHIVNMLPSGASYSYTLQVPLPPTCRKLGFRSPLFFGLCAFNSLLPLFLPHILLAISHYCVCTDQRC